MIKHDFLKIWEGLKAKNLNAKFLIGNALFLTPFNRNRKPFFNIMYGLSHRPDQLYHLWKFIGWSLDYFEEYSWVSSVFIPAFIANIGKHFFLKYDYQNSKSI